MGLIKKVARILSIDGGGIRGLIPATIIKDWEKTVGLMSDRFHMIAGTSTGGILACGLAQGTSAVTLSDFYIKEGPKIFASSWSALGGAAGELYNALPLEQAVSSALHGSLSNIVPELLVTSYDIENRQPFLFKNWKARGYELQDNERAADNDFMLKDVSRATSAAPTFFTPAKITNRTGKTYALIDGGVYANNPAMCAYVAARRLYPKADEYLIVSLGTGAIKKPIQYSDAVSFGILGWARPLLDIMFDGVSATTEYELSQLGVTQYRFQASLVGANEAMDDVSTVNLAALQKIAQKAVSPSDSAALLSRLLEPMTSRASLGYPKQDEIAQPAPLITITPPRKIDQAVGLFDKLVRLIS